MTDFLGLVRDADQQLGGTAVLIVLLRVTLLLSATILVAIGLRRRSASLRHLVWMLSLLGTLLIDQLPKNIPENRRFATMATSKHSFKR